MPTCNRKGCGKEFDPAKNSDGDCQYHPGGPIFHEGLKCWSCCKEVNKPVLTFDEFMAIPVNGKHTLQVQESAPPPSVKTSTHTVTASEGKEVYTTAAASPTLAAQTSLPKPVPAVPKAPKEPAKPVPIEIEDDEPGVKVEPGTKCKRNGCNAVYVDDETHRTEGGKEAVCVFHPAPPIFHEGSKGYMCCKRRVLEFDEFLRITGCTTGKHLFVGKPKSPEAEEELVQCRIDHYQTPKTVQVSVFAKKTGKESMVRFGEQSVELDLHLPERKRFTKTLRLYGPINAEESGYTILATKVELKLVKADTRSWNMLEQPREGTPVPEGFNLTFGVGGRTGTIGAKDVILDEGNKLKRAGTDVKA
ncbi:chord-domain-containing protein [Dacryopinax primogenitus]|uniref:Chord-domain-containing protein n=1 Tax=Dacryopinax primogenitus (strain DJM 731) TaxID=1858805 RepID=M5GEU9_DACPD|nr:chord-domain-containing protein [Dacryopinax primogenitus]EJU05697.1 chord-domain-containing protein [Dacryopinax primogenitus]